LHSVHCDDGKISKYAAEEFVKILASPTGNFDKNL
jgi:hypothetical protein